MSENPTDVETKSSIQGATINLDKMSFFLDLLRSLTGRIEEISGEETAARYISLVGGEIGNEINNAYMNALNKVITSFSLHEVAAMLVDLKRRIGGEFYVSSIKDNGIVLYNTRCPFGDHVINRPSLCMMTSNVFGQIAASHFSYANIEIQQAIARGDSQCKVVVSLDKSAYKAIDSMREYYAKKPLPSN